MKSLYQEFINDLDVPFDKVITATVSAEEWIRLNDWATRLVDLEKTLEKDPAKNHDHLKRLRCFRINMNKMSEISQQ